MLKRSLALLLTLIAVAPIGARAYGTGLIAYPEAEPTALAVFAHGYSHRSPSWARHMERTADAGAIAVTMDYRGTYVDGAGNIRGWFVQEGADDMVAVATEILTACTSIETVVLYGVSMGGNASGLALTRGAVRPNDPEMPLFDFWVAAEPAANVVETYLEASAVAPANAFAALAKADIEQAFGGTIAEQPQAYADAAVVARALDISRNGLRGAFVVHGLDDGLVPTNQGRELATALRAVNISTEYLTVARRNPDGDPNHEGGTTLTENVGSPLFAGLGLGQYPEPLAGHGSESSQTHIVIQTGLDLVLGLIAGTREHQGNAEWLVDGEAGSIRIA
jgi:hypothetical protein